MPLRGVGDPEVHDLGVSGRLIGALQGVVGADFVVWSPLPGRPRALPAPTSLPWALNSTKHALLNPPTPEKTPLSTPLYMGCAEGCAPGRTCISLVEHHAVFFSGAVALMIARARAPYTPMYTPEHACTQPTRVDVSSHVRSMRRGVAADIVRARLRVANTPPITHLVRRTSCVHRLARHCAGRCTTVFRRRSPWTTVPRADVQTPVEVVVFY